MRPLPRSENPGAGSRATISYGRIVPGLYGKNGSREKMVVLIYSAAASGWPKYSARDFAPLCFTTALI